jgi:hypothetical protein
VPTTLPKRRAPSSEKEAPLSFIAIMAAFLMIAALFSISVGDAKAMYPTDGPYYFP